MSRNNIFYIFALLIFILSIWIIIDYSKGWETPKYTINSQINTEKNDLSYSTKILIKKNDIIQKNNINFIFDTIVENFQHPLTILLFQLIAILAISRIFAFLITKIGQPSVIGEIIAGIILGPSLLGHFFPGTFAFLFPLDSLNNLAILSQIGLILFMFIIGMELDLSVLKHKAQSALIISHTSIMVSYFLGFGLAFYLYTYFQPENIKFLPFALFIGIAMSIAAFPILARIVQERGLTRTPLGRLIITIAAIDDLTAWCILATVIAYIKAGTVSNALFSILLVCIYLIAMIFAVQPFLKKMSETYVNKEILNKRVIAFVFLILFLSAFTTEVIGIKALFGGFLAGVIMPSKQNFKKLFSEKIEDLSLVVLLPLFFVLTGLRTQIGLLSESNLWLTCVFIIFTATIGKFGGSFIAARIVGQSWKNSLTIGFLMNTRGLMELIVLNIGYEIGIISPVIYTMMVIMTLVTTFMTGPVLTLIDKIYLKYSESLTPLRKKTYNILISFGMAHMGATLLKITQLLIANKTDKFKISAMHLTPNTELSHTSALNYEQKSFEPIKLLARSIKYDINTIYKTTEDINKEIIKTTKSENINLLLIGASKNSFSNSKLIGRVKSLVENLKCNTGIVIEKNIKKLECIILFVDKNNSFNMINIAKAIFSNVYSKIVVFDTEDVFLEEDFKFEFASIDKNNLGSSIEIVKSNIINEGFLEHFDLIMISLPLFDNINKEHNVFTESSTSIIIFNFIDNSLSALN